MEASGQASSPPPSLVSKYSTPSFYSSIKEKQKEERKKVAAT
jgi:hypothetical protein